MDLEKRLAVIVLGKGNSGKTATWKSLFGRKVHSNPVSTQPLDLDNGAVVEVMLRNASCEERNKPIKARLPKDAQGEIVFPGILLLAVQYSRGQRGKRKVQPEQTISFLLDNGYDLYVQWLNPGYRKPAYDDFLGIVSWLAGRGVAVDKWSAFQLEDRTARIREAIGAWARGQGLVGGPGPAPISGLAPGPGPG